MNALLATASFVSRATDDGDFDPNSVTPGVVGFLITFLVAVAAVFIAIDMNRRVRRTQYRTEIREKLAAEQAGDVDPGESPEEPEAPEQAGPREP